MTRNGSSLQLMFVLICGVILSLLPGSATLLAASPASPAASQETLRRGERIYREGILPSGEPLRASIQGGLAVPGMTFACISCHLRSGLGALDEGIYTPPINGAKLFRPLLRRYKGVEVSADAAEPLRPAYTEQSLFEVLRSGRSPNGRVLHEGMPRYLLEDKDARVLVTYLKALSSQFSPGVSADTIRFATVISEDVRPEKSQAMLAAFDSCFTMQNNQVKNLTDSRTRLMANIMLGRELADKTFSLSRWTLKGPPETWRRQLEEYNRTEPVFALLGGIVGGDWRPIHQFCEDNGIPCLFPTTDFPVVSETDWYTLYLSKGYYQEGESAARYLNGREDLLKGSPVVQVVRPSREAEALAAGFQQTWQNLGQQAAVTVPLPPGKILDRDFLHQVLAREKPAVLIIWDDATALPVLESVSRRDSRPEMVFLSARYLGESTWTLPESIRDVVYLTYPFAFSPVVASAAMGKQKVQDDRQQTLRQADVPLKDEVKKIVSLTNALTQLLSSLLIELRGNYYRDNLLDVAGMMADQQYPLYGRISFGTGQRYAARGCFIVQLAHGENPELVKKSSWEIP